MASKVDPNVYALAVQLSLDSSAAFDDLDVFENKMIDLESKLIDVADKAITAFDNSIISATSSIGLLDKSFTGVEQTTIKITTNLQSAAKELNDQFETNEKQLKNVEELLDHMEKLQKIQLDMGKELQKHLDINDKFLKGTEEVVKAVKQKNIGHTEQNKLLDNDIKAIKSMNGELGSTNNNLRQNEASWSRSSQQALKLWQLVKQIDADTEKFTTTNYRAYGSQSDLVQSVRSLSIESGIYYKNALEAYAVMADLRVPRDELNKYAKAIGEANRYTGVSVQSLGVFANRMRGSGQDAAATDRQLKVMAESMRKFGLTTSDVNRIVSDTAVSSGQLRLIYANKDAVQGIDNIKAALTGVNKQYGLNTESANSYINLVSKDATARIRLSDLTNTEIKNTNDLAKAISKAGEGIRASGGDVDDALSMTSATAQMTRESLAEAYTGGDVDALLMLLQVSKLNDELGKEVNTVEDLNAILAKAKDSGLDPFNESNHTLTSQLQILNERFKNTIGMVLQLAADALVPVLRIINWLIGGIVEVVGWFGQLRDWLIKTIPGFEYLAIAAKWLIGIQIALAIGLMLVVGGMSAFATAASGASGVVAGATKVMLNMGQTMVQMATYIGEAIKIILRSIGQGLAELGNAVKPVIGPLLGLGLAFLLVGVGAYFFALALQIVVQQGAAAIPAVIGMIIVIAILGLVLIGLASMIQGPIAVGMIILAVAFVAIGAAALMVGLGLMYAGKGIQLLADSLSFKLILQIGMLGLVLISLGAMALVALPGLLLLSFVLVILAGAAMLLGLSFGKIISQTQELVGVDSANIMRVGLEFMVAGLAFVIAGGALLLASGLFMVAAPAILVAMAIMSVVSTLMLPVAGAFFVGSAALLMASLIFFIASLLITPAAIAFFGSAVLISAGSILLAAGAIALVAGATLLAAGGGLLMAAGLSLKIGLLFIGGSADKIYDIGNKIGVGGILLLIGAQSIVTAAALLMQSSDNISAISNLLDENMPKLASAANKLQFAGFMLMLGSLNLIDAANIIGPTSAAIYDGISLLAQSGILLIDSADNLQAGSLMLGESSSLLKDAASELGMAGDWLAPASFSIYLGMRWLGYAVQGFVRNSEDVLKISKAVALLASSFHELSTIPINGFRDVAAGALEAIPNVELLADRLTAASKKLSESVNEFSGPANQLAEIFERLAAATANFNANIKVDEDVERLSTMLDKYTDLVENSTARIEAAIATKALPAIKSAEDSGMSDVIQSEAISTVKVMNEVEGDEGFVDRNAETQLRIASLLESLNTKLDEIGRDSIKRELVGLVELLTEFLPNINQTDSGLSNQLNSWSS